MRRRRTAPSPCCAGVPHVARSSCYAWREGVAARRRRQAADDALAHEITVPHLASHRTYGVPSVHAELRRLGRRANRKGVARVVRERDIRGVTRAEVPPAGWAAGVYAA
ncbi:IS3 family transposase [Streptomyces sp. ITFR-6]|uniref:IS3 family transposase n=1 Tax=Streptomyces sp. ITFR-6 TaxID=3075197 RepID=UPI0037DA0096